MDLNFIKIAILFIIFTLGLPDKNKNILLVKCLLFTILFYLIIPTVKIYKEGYQDYKLKVNGVNHLVKLLQEMIKQQEIDKTVVINNDLTKDIKSKL